MLARSVYADIGLAYGDSVVIFLMGAGADEHNRSSRFVLRPFMADIGITSGAVAVVMAALQVRQATGYQANRQPWLALQQATSQQTPHCICFDLSFCFLQCNDYTYYQKPPMRHVPHTTMLQRVQAAMDSPGPFTMQKVAEAAAL